MTIAETLWGSVVNEIFILLQGDGANGKRTEDHLIRGALGGYHVHLNARALTRETKEPDGANPALISTFGARYISSDGLSPSDYLHNSPVKHLSGGDSNSTRDRHGKYFSFRTTGMLHIQTIGAPKFEQLTQGVVDRCRIIEYPYRFVTNPIKGNEKLIDSRYAKAFRTKDYHHGFMLRVLETYKVAFQDSKQLVFPNSVISFSKKSLMTGMTATDWLDDHCDVTENPTDAIFKTEIWDRYMRTHTRSRYGELMKVKAFHRELGAVLKVKRLRLHKPNAAEAYIGIRFKPHDSAL